MQKYTKLQCPFKRITARHEKMNTAEIIQKTYVEYLPDGTKRDRYREEYLKQIQLTSNNDHKKEKLKHKKKKKEKEKRKNTTINKSTI